MKALKIIPMSELESMLEQEERVNGNYLKLEGEQEVDGLLCIVYEDIRTHTRYASREIRTIHMGFNYNEEGKVEEFVAVVEREGACHASWGVTGRTMHMILAGQLADSLPQYDWEIGYNYLCKATKK